MITTPHRHTANRNYPNRTVNNIASAHSEGSRSVLTSAKSNQSLRWPHDEDNTPININLNREGVEFPVGIRQFGKSLTNSPSFGKNFVPKSLDWAIKCVM